MSEPGHRASVRAPWRACRRSASPARRHGGRRFFAAAMDPVRHVLRSIPDGRGDLFHIHGPTTDDQGRSRECTLARIQCTHGRLPIWVGDRCRSSTAPSPWVGSGQAGRTFRSFRNISSPSSPPRMAVAGPHSRAVPVPDGVRLSSAHHGAAVWPTPWTQRCAASPKTPGDAPAIHHR